MIHVRLSGNAKHAKITDWEIEDDTIHNTIIQQYIQRYLNRAYFVQITTVQLYFVYSAITISIYHFLHTTLLTDPFP